MKKLLPLLILTLFLGAYASRIQYEGERNEKGEYHGQGTLTYPNGVKYVGEFKDGKEHGQETFTARQMEYAFEADNFERRLEIAYD